MWPVPDQGFRIEEVGLALGLRFTVVHLLSPPFRLFTVFN